MAHSTAPTPGGTAGRDDPGAASPAASANPPAASASASGAGPASGRPAAIVQTTLDFRMPGWRGDGRVVVVGTGAAMGDWDPDLGLPLRRLERVPGGDPDLWRGTCDLPRDAEGWYKAVVTRPDRVDEWSADEDRPLPPPADPKRANATLFQETAAYAAQHGRAAEQPEKEHPLEPLITRNNVVVAASANANASVRVDAVLPSTTSDASPAGGTPKPPSVLATVVFRATARLQPGQHLRVVGAAPELGAWDPLSASAPAMTWSEGDRWTCAVALDAFAAFGALDPESPAAWFDFKLALVDERAPGCRENEPPAVEWSAGENFRLAREADAADAAARMRQWLAGEGFELRVGAKPKNEEERASEEKGGGASSLEIVDVGAPGAFAAAAVDRRARGGNRRRGDPRRVRRKGPGGRDLRAADSRADDS